MRVQRAHDAPHARRHSCAVCPMHSRGIGGRCGQVISSKRGCTADGVGGNGCRAELTGCNGGECAFGAAAQARVPHPRSHASGAGPYNDAGALPLADRAAEDCASVGERWVGTDVERPVEAAAGDAMPHSRESGQLAPPSTIRLLSGLPRAPVSRKVKCGALASRAGYRHHARHAIESPRRSAVRLPQAAGASQNWLSAAGAAGRHSTAAANLEKSQERMHAMSCMMVLDARPGRDAGVETSSVCMNMQTDADRTHSQRLGVAAIRGRQR